MEETEVMVRVEMEELFQDMSLEVEAEEEHPMGMEEDLMVHPLEEKQEEEAIFQVQESALQEVLVVEAVAEEEEMVQAGRVGVLELVPGHLEDMAVEEVQDLEVELVFMVAVEGAILPLRVLARAVLEEAEEEVVMDRLEHQAPLAAAAALVRVREETVREELAVRMPRQCKAAMERL
jgi:hypothetical protein